MTKTLVNSEILGSCTLADRLVGENVQQIAHRAELLEQPERQLMLLWLLGQHSLRELGRLLNRNPGALSRRIRRLVRRLNDPVTAALQDRGRMLAEQMREIGLEHFVRGRPAGVLARRYGLTRGQVMEALGFIRAWATVRPAVVGEGGRDE